MNVCFVNMPVEYYSPRSGGAVSTVTAELASELEGMGHHVRVVTYTDDTECHPAGSVTDLGAMPRPSLPARAADRATRRLLRRPFAGYEQYRRRVARAVRGMRPRPDVIVVANDLAAPGFLRRLAPDARTVAWLHNEPPRHRSGQIDDPDLIVTVSDYIRERAIAGGADPDRVVTIANGVNPAVFSPAGRCDGDRPRVLCIGRIDPNKGFHVAMAALQRLRDSGVSFDLTLAGAHWWYGSGQLSDYERALVNAVHDLGGDYVGLVPRDRIADLYREHDLAFVLSLSQEPFGLVTLEAMASGVAVIASPRGGLLEATAGAAVIVDPDDPDAVAAAARSLLTDPDELHRWQRRGLARAGKASWHSRAEQFVDVVTAMQAA